MQKELKSKKTETGTAPQIDPSTIKQEYAQLPEQQPQMTQEQINAQRDEMEKNLDRVLPFLRKQEEATRLEIELTRMDVRMGRLNPKNVPGSLGKELEIEVMQNQIMWAQLTMQQQELVKQAMDEKAKLEEEQKKMQGQTATK